MMKAIRLIPILVLIESASCFSQSRASMMAFGTKSFQRSSFRLHMIPKKTNTKNGAFFPFDEGNEVNNESKIQLSARKGPNEEASDGSAGVRQLLGVKGASVETDIWKIRLQLTKPVTWVPLVWGVMCGAAASGNYHWMWNPLDPNDRDVALGFTDACKGFVGMILAGPFLTGYTQTINDWYDREIDGMLLFLYIVYIIEPHINLSKFFDAFSH